ncbi:MAG: ribosome recycling factor [Candidatus Terrybacteria bacterium]|nr:ribosome recycling factor [Candidatus Terrybacteria bacterium]
MPDLEKKIGAILARIAQDLIAIRGGRAMPGLVEDIVVEHYGTKMPLKQLASITVPEAKTIAVTPWDKCEVGEVGLALVLADLGVMPSIHGEVIHITLPPLTQDRRTQLLRFVGKTVEEGRIALRREREEAIEELKVRERKGEISEDALFRGKEQIEEAVKRANEKLEELRVQKEQELETV